MWIKTEAAFMPTRMSETEFELLNETQKDEHSDWTPFRFNTDDLCAYNTSADKKYTTIRLKSGFDIRVKMGIEQIDKHIFKLKTDV